MPQIGRRRALVALAAGVLALAPALAAGNDELLDFHSTWTWTALSMRPNTPAIAVADLELDGRSEIVVLGESYPVHDVDESGYWFTLHQEGDRYQQAWSSLGSESRLRGMEVVSDPVPLVIVWTSLSVDVYEGASKALLRSIPLPSDEIVSVRVADLDGQPGRELVACDLYDLFEFDFENGELRGAHYGFGGSALAVGEADGDPAKEIAIAGSPLGGYLLDGATFDVEWGRLEGFGPRVWLADVDDDGLVEVYFLDGWPSVLTAIDPRTDEVLWTHDASELGTVEMGIIEGSGFVFAGVDQYSGVTIVGATDGVELWSMPFESPYVDAIVIGDVDSDAATEILVGSREDTALTTIDAELRAVEAQQVLAWGPFLGLAVRDIDADGNREVSTSAARRVNGFAYWDPLTLGVESRRVEVSAEPTAGPEGAVVAVETLQIDGDDALEVCFAVRESFFGRVRCLDGATWSEDFVWTPPGNPLGMATADLSGDGRFELFVAVDDDSVAAFGGQPFGSLWQSAVYGTVNYRSTLRVGQADGEPAMEVVLAGMGNNRTSVVVLDAQTGALESGPFNVGARSVEIGPFGSGNAPQVTVGTFAGQVAPLDLGSGTLGPPLATFADEIRSLRSADFDRDGAPDLAIATEGKVTILDGASGLPSWISPFLDYAAADRDSLYVGDLEGNGVPDLFVDLGIGFAVFEGPLLELFLDGFESGETDRWSFVQP